MNPRKEEVVKREDDGRRSLSKTLYRAAAKDETKVRRRGRREGRAEEESERRRMPTMERISESRDKARKLSFKK